MQLKFFTAWGSSPEEAAKGAGQMFNGFFETLSLAQVDRMQISGSMVPTMDGRGEHYCFTLTVFVP